MTARQKAEARDRTKVNERSDTHYFLVGGGIASLAAAAFLIRDGGVLGKNITVLEQMSRLGGSLDGCGSPENGYVVRGGRMMESKYLCTYDLFSSIPTLDRTRTVTQEIFAWNEVIKTNSHSRLVRAGKANYAPEFELSERQILKLEWLTMASEASLGRSSIVDQMGEDFLKTNFWFMWCTTFAFQPWHSAVEFKRYLSRFMHMVQGFNQLKGIMRTVLNQYDSLIRPLETFLAERHVNFRLETRVVNLATEKIADLENRVEGIVISRNGMQETLALGPLDKVIVTLGSMTESSSLGDDLTQAALKSKQHGGAWTFWENIAQNRVEFGRPSVFADHVRESKWISITTTLYDHSFIEFVRDLTGNIPGEGGLVTFADSNWLCSIVVPAQPHFANQPADIDVVWGYGLYVDRPGNFVSKPMEQCSGREIFEEILGHLSIPVEMQASMLAKSRTIPCMMPFITSQFLRREKGDRPEIRPEGWTNLAFVGQFTEQPDDVVFTVEYSIRNAASAVYSLLGVERTPPAVYKGTHNPGVLLSAFKSLHDLV